VDGELSARQRKQVARLLAKSVQARQLLQRLQADRDSLRSLRPQRLPDHFADQIVRRLPARRTLPVSGRRPTYRWWPVVAAAAVIVGIGIGTAFLVNDLRNLGNAAGNNGTSELVQQPGAQSSSPSGTGSDEITVPADKATGFANAEPRVEPDPERLATGVREPSGSPNERSAPLLPDAPPPFVASPKGSERDRLPGEEPFAHSPIFTAPPLGQAAGFKTLDIKLALFLEPRSLDLPALAARLQSEPVHHVDIACQESSRSFERLQAACHAAGVKLTVEAELAQRLAKKLPTAFLIYLENTSPEQVVKLMAALGREEELAEARKKGDAQIESIMVQPLDEAGRKRLAEALGVPSATLNPLPVSSESLSNLDPTRPIAEGTIKSLEKLASKGKEAAAIALVYYPNRTRMPPSRELKQFHDSRLGLEGKAIHVVFFLRPTRG
jgi:hypothetical protein